MFNHLKEKYHNITLCVNDKGGRDNFFDLDDCSIVIYEKGNSYKAIKRSVK